MKTIFNKVSIAILLSVGCCFWISCKEQTATPGDLIPEIDNIHTFGLEAEFFNPSLNVAVLDSLITSDYKTNLAGIGKVVNDPFYGSLTEGMFFQVVPPVAFFKFPNGAVLDSAFIMLPYSGYSYGDEHSPSTNYQHLNIYQITEPFNKSTEYYSFQSLMFNNQRIGGGTYSLQDLRDTVNTPVDTMSNMYRLKLDNSFALSVFNADESRFISAGAFQEFLKGFYIVPVDTSAIQNRISYFKLLGESGGSSASLAFYYRDSEGKASKANFPFSSSASAYFTKITRDNSGTPSQNFLNSNRNADSILIQGTPGFYTEITLSNIDQIPVSVINKAQIIITSLVSGDLDVYGNPLRLLIETKDSSGKLSPIADLYGADGSLSNDGLTFVDANAKAVSINGQKHVRYVVNFPRELQRAMIQGKSQITFRLSTPNSYPAAFRLLADGFGGQEETKLKTSIIYTKK